MIEVGWAALAALTCWACVPTAPSGDAPVSDTDGGADANLTEAGADASTLLPGTVIWARSFGRGGDDGYGEAGCMPGECAFTGDGIPRAGGGVHFTTTYSLSPNDMDLAWVSVDSRGGTVAERVFGDGTRQLGKGIAEDSTGDVWLAGTFGWETGSSIDFGGGTLVAAPVTGRTMLLAKFSADGTYEQAETVTATSSAHGDRLVVSGGAVFATGTFQGELSFRGRTLVNPNSVHSDAFLAKLSIADVAWAKQPGFTSDESIAALCALPNGGVVEVINDYLTDWDSSADVVIRYRDAFGAEAAWTALTAPDEGFGARAADCATDAIGNVYVAGDFWSALTEATAGMLTANPAHDAYVVKLDERGELVWKRQFGGADGQGALALALSKDGSTVYAGGWFDGTTDLGYGPVDELAGAGLTDGWVVALDGGTGDTHRWSDALRFGEEGASVAVTRLVVDTEGDLFAVGTFSQRVGFGDEELVSVGGRDIFVLKVQP